VSVDIMNMRITYRTQRNTVRWQWREWFETKRKQNEVGT